MIAPRKLQLRRGNTAAISTYVGAPGELIVNTDNSTLYIHDGVTVGGRAATVNTASTLNAVASAEANIILANTIQSAQIASANIGIKGYVDLANSIQSAQITSANLGIIGYIDQSNTIQSAQVGAANLAITAANLGLKGYVDLANTIQSNQIATANIGIIGYINQGNTIQAAAITAANLGMKGYVDSVTGGSSYSNVNVKAYTESMGFQNFSNVNVAAYLTSQGVTGGSYSNVNATSLITSLGLSNYSNVNVNAYTETMGYQNFGNVNVAAYVTTANSAIIGYIDLANTIQSAQVGAANLAIIDANLGMKGYVDSVASQSIYGDGNVKSYLTQFDDDIIPSGNLIYSLGSHTNRWKDLYLGSSTIYIGNTAISSTTSGTISVTPKIVLVDTSITSNDLAFPWALTSNPEVLANTSSSVSATLVFANTISEVTTSQSLTYGTDYELVPTGDGYANIRLTGLNISSPPVGWPGYGQLTIIETPPAGGTTDISGNLTVSGNIANVRLGTSGVLTFADGTTQTTASTGGGGSYGNANVASYLPTYSGVVTAGNVAVNGNVTAQYLFGNGSQLTGIVGGAGNYGNIDVKAFLGTDAGFADGYQRVIEGYYSNIILGDTTKLFSFGNSSKSYFGHDGFANININYARADNSDVRIATNNGAYTWVFNNGGNLTFPGNLVIAGNTNVFGTNGALIQPADDLPLIALSSGANGAVSSIWVEDYANIGTSNIAAVYANPTVGSKIVRIAVGQNGGAGPNLWDFGTGGTTRFPGSKILAPAGESITMQSDQYSQLMWENANVTVAPNIATYSNFYVAQNNATLDIGYRDGSSNSQYKEWLWSVDGNLKLPSGGYILNSDDSIYGAGSSYSNVEVATYLPTYSGNIANIRLGVAGVLTFADGTTQITAGGGSYSNVQVATYLPTYAGTVSASLVNTSGNILSSGLSVFGNTRIGLAGAVSGQFHSVVGNITQTSSGGAVYINTTGNVLAAAVVAGAVTSTGTVAVNAATGITTNQATFLLANASATTINMGGAATTINLGSTASATGNVFVGGQIGSNAYNLTLRANGRYNTATSIDSNGGFNSPPYANQAVIGGTGTGMTANYSATGGYLTTLTIYNSGTGYRNGDVISVPGGVAGNSFVLQNYSPSRVGAFTGTALYTFGIDGNLTVPGNISISSGSSYFLGNSVGTTAAYTGNVSANYFLGNGALLTGVATKITGSWTVPTGNSTQSFTVASGTYQLWVDCNIPNGILVWNATATVTNSNVPVVGQQFAWVYDGGGTPIDFTSIPNQFVGTGNTIVRSSVSPSATTNRFDFGINNTSGGNVTVSYGYVKIS